jgi:hypothetical protein
MGRLTAFSLRGIQQNAPILISLNRANAINTEYPQLLGSGKRLALVIMRVRTTRVSAVAESWRRIRIRKMKSAPSEGMHGDFSGSYQMAQLYDKSMRPLPWSAYFLYKVNDWDD